MGDALHKVVVKTFIEQDGKILLLKRTTSAQLAPGMWDLPGGKYEDGEAIEACLAREVLEETGLIIDEATLFFAYASPRPDNKTTIAILYRSKAHGDITLSEEHTQYQWIAIEDIDDNALHPGLLPAFKRMRMHRDRT